jgi:hypothetical protein
MRARYLWPKSTNFAGENCMLRNPLRIPEWLVFLYIFFNEFLPYLVALAWMRQFIPQHAGMDVMKSQVLS